MQERVNEKTVAVVVQATKMSGRMIARIGEMYLRHVREKHRDNKLAKSRDPSTYKRNRAGKVKIRTLMQEKYANTKALAEQGDPQAIELLAEYDRRIAYRKKRVSDQGKRTRRTYNS